jgi:hypothetical protein
MSPLRILVTGSRHWTNRHVIAEAIKKAVADSGRTIDDEDVIVVHGGAPGADKIADSVAFRLAYQVEAHPADWETHGAAAGPIRNAEMVALGADVCLAFPIGPSRGTRGCMALAEKAGIPVVVTEGVPA